MRMFFFSDPVPEIEARAALGDRLAPLLDAGFLRRLPDGSIVSPFVLSMLDDLLVLSDDLTLGGEAVMGFGDGTIELCRAAFSERGLGAVLDLGCGSGTVALALARSAARVIATDINPRAIDLARLNAALNGLPAIDVRRGDLFAPVAGEQLDLVTSQPPFVPRPEGAESATFLYGGQVGDELALSLLRGLVPRLAVPGRAVLRVDWPDHGSAPLASRLREALGEEADLLVLRAPLVSPEDHATAYAAGLHPLLDASFEREVERRLAHLDRTGIRGISPTLTIVQRTGSARAFTDTLDVRPLGQIHVTSARIDKLLRARAIAGKPEDLLAARLRVPEGTVLAQEQVGPGAEVESTLLARFADTALVPPMAMTGDLLFLATFLHEAPDARAGLSRFAEQHEASAQEVIDQLLPAVERALLAGLLEVDDGPRALT
jgi:SAM-dependent methyltransferase